MSRPRVTTAVEAVAADLERRILDGDLPPGDRLPEEALAAHYEVARHTVRAALRALAAGGLVTVETHRGAHVTALDDAALADLFALRAALEVEAARLLAEQEALDPLPPAVLAAAAHLDEACTGDPSDARVRARADAAHAALHHALVAAAASRRITLVHEALTAESRLALVQSRAALPLPDLARDHRALLAALAAEGPHVLRDHLRHGQRAASGTNGSGRRA